MTEPEMDEVAVRMNCVCAIVSAYVSRNAVSPTELTVLIRDVKASIRIVSDTRHTNILVAPHGNRSPSREEIQASITHTALVSFIDGRSYTTLKRHISAHGMTPNEYRDRFGLPSDYPMVTEEYSFRRSALAKKFELGRRPRA